MRTTVIKALALIGLLLVMELLVVTTAKGAPGKDVLAPELVRLYPCSLIALCACGLIGL